VSAPSGEIGIEELARRLEELTVVDVRALEEFDGRLGAPCDPRQGHIPGAIHLELEELLLLDAAAVGARLGLTPGQEVVAYCHSGSRSGVAVGILAGHGYAARNYRGSWHEWSRSDLPAETPALD
jgi:thiosulfate/3-mercaptopyruvate sulfurtransferase